MIDKNKIEKLSKDLRKVIEGWAKENGLERTGNFNIKYSEHSFRLSSALEFVESAAKNDVAAQNYAEGLLVVNMKRQAMGLRAVPAHNYNDTMFYDGSYWMFKEVKTRSPKYPFILENMDTGKQIKATAELLIGRMLT